MSNKEAKTEETKLEAPPIDKVQATFAATEKSFADLEARAATMRREIRDQAEAHARSREERQRTAAQWDYEEEQRRRAILDRQKEEDRERERQFAERNAAIVQREKQVIEVATELLGVTGTPFDPKQAKANLDKKLTEAENRGKAIAKAEAERDYTTKKLVDDATAAKNLALLEAENARLKADNAKLEAENKRLSTDVMELAKRQGDLAKDAFGSAGGIQRQAMDSLQSAAQNAPRTNPR